MIKKIIRFIKKRKSNNKYNKYEIDTILNNLAESGLYIKSENKDKKEEVKILNFFLKFNNKEEKIKEKIEYIKENLWNYEKLKEELNKEQINIIETIKKDIILFKKNNIKNII